MKASSPGDGDDARGAADAAGIAGRSDTGNSDDAGAAGGQGHVEVDEVHEAAAERPDRWQALRRFTHARIALGRSGSSLPTAPLLAFSLAHAQARDAVHLPLDAPALHAQLHAAGFATLDVHSAAPDREHYLRRPDLGRALDDASAARLTDHAVGVTGEVADEGSSATSAPAVMNAARAPDVVFVIADGLSALAATRHALPLLELMRARLAGWHIGPVVVARQARVALGDGIGALLRARMVVVLIGERPGLSSPDSLGIYLTYAPHVGCSDAQRNCISNVRPQGLPYPGAAFKLHYLLNEARRLSMTGVGLKDHSDLLLASDDTAAAKLPR